MWFRTSKASLIIISSIFFSADSSKILTLLQLFHVCTPADVTIVLFCQLLFLFLFRCLEKQLRDSGLSWHYKNTPIQIY